MSEERMKNVFLIGDSIREGYCEFVKEKLKDIADVRFPNENCRDTTYTLIGLGFWADALYPDYSVVDLVYWNNSHWDCSYYDEDELLMDEKRYANMLWRIHKRLRRYFPNAKIVFNTAVPMNPQRLPNCFDSRLRTTSEDLHSFNRAAEELFKGTDVYFDDLFQHFEELDVKYYKDYAHLTDEGNEIASDYIAGYIREMLSK